VRFFDVGDPVQIVVPVGGRRAGGRPRLIGG
jgi:hypothetical protein